MSESVKLVAAAAEVEQLLPPLDDLVEQVVDERHHVVAARPQRPGPLGHLVTN